MNDDDEIRGRVLTRREMLGVLGSLGAALLVACSGDDGEPQPAATATGDAAPAATRAASGGATTTATTLPSCIVVPALAEGPYFVDTQLDRSDIRSDPGGAATRQGAELALTINVLSVSGGSCTPLAGAVVDIWQCDALGAYSDVVDTGQGFNTRGQRWLRGLQTSGGNGQVRFTTVYPGWYPGRATHIHFMVRRENREFTSQFFFDDALSNEIHDSLAPYTQRGSRGRTQNAADGIFRQSNGMLQLNVQKSSNAYTATFDLGIRL